MSEPSTYADFELFPDEYWEVMDIQQAKTVAIFFDEDRAKDYVVYLNGLIRAGVIA